MDINVCPTCGREFAPSVTICPNDGATLRPSASRKTPPGAIGTLVGSRVTSEQEAADIKSELAAERARPTDPLSRASIADDEPRRHLGVIVAAAVVVVVVVGLIAMAMRR